ncbi:MAG: hypothetical protein ACE5MH_08870 [Terriglobia bacterium]
MSKPKAKQIARAPAETAWRLDNSVDEDLRVLARRRDRLREASDWETAIEMEVWRARLPSGSEAVSLNDHLRVLAELRDEAEAAGDLRAAADAEVARCQALTSNTQS